MKRNAIRCLIKREESESNKEQGKRSNKNCVISFGEERMSKVNKDKQ